MEKFVEESYEKCRSFKRVKVVVQRAWEDGEKLERNARCKLLEIRSSLDKY